MLAKPNGQGEHDASDEPPEPELKVPAGQEMQVDAPASEYVAIGQVRQTSAEVAPVVVLAVPALQSVHLAVPVEAA